MTDTDWREILSFSQKDLKQADKEKLCESLSWMEADDIELNFTDLKTLFRLAQDILKYKSEQVNNLLGELEAGQRKSIKSKSKTSAVDSPAKSSDDILETIAHQEEVIKANKEILEQLYTDIAELEKRKNKLDDQNDFVDKDSESSRDALSEMNAMAQLENELTIKNKHIRKLLSNVKLLEEENAQFKEKVSILKDKLTEATKLIENFTEQLLTLNNENTKLKEFLGKCEQSKAQLATEIQSLKKQLFEKEYNRENAYEEIKSKVQHWKNVAKAKKTEIEKLSNENTKLKEHIIRTTQPSPTTSPKKNNTEQLKIKELQEKLSEASNEILQSAKLIDLLRAENRQLKSFIEEVPDSVTEVKNESDDGKERAIINKQKKKIKTLTVALQEADEMITVREKELMEITSQLRLIQSEEGISVLLEGIKNKKRQLKYKDEGIKSLVHEVNTLNQLVDELQLENETLRQKFDIPSDEKISTKGILKKYHDMEKNYSELNVELKEIENKLVSVELDNRDLRLKITKLIKALNNLGYDTDKIKQIYESSDSEIETQQANVSKISSSSDNSRPKNSKSDFSRDEEMRAIIEENEGLRNGLEDILNFLKDNSTTSSGVLTLECPSLEDLLRSMEARHAAGWFAPHMTTVLQLRAALGGKDALLSALHEARKETYSVIAQLEKESAKSNKLQQKIHEMETIQKLSDEKEQIIPSTDSKNISEFGTWMSEKELKNVNFTDKTQIEPIIAKGNTIYEDHLKKSLSYFHERFKILFDKMTSTTIQASDDLNKWSIQEEQYKAQIENLKAQLVQKDDEDLSDDSPGLIEIPSTVFLQRKCSYLEESYKYIRTSNENMKNELLQSKKDMMTMNLEFECKVQNLIIAVASLTDKLRFSIPIDLFWNQSLAMNESLIKYRNVVDSKVKNKDEEQELMKYLENIKLDILNSIRQNSPDLLGSKTGIDEPYDECNLKLLANIEQSVTQKQLEQLCAEIKVKNKTIENLEAQNTKLQESQAKIIDETLAAMTKDEIDHMKEDLQKLVNDNKLLKEQCQHVSSQLDIALLQLQDNQQRQMSNDMEINMLRHQIIDLQSTNDNKAVVAKLSSEVLVAHLQTTESFKKIERLKTSLNNEKQLRAEAEEMLNARQKIFDLYTSRYESKFRYIYDVMHILRQQYQGSIPLASIENYLNKMEDLSRKSHATNEQLFEIEDLQSRLMIKHTVFEQILDLSKNKCIDIEDNCPHMLKMTVQDGIHCRELELFNKKINILEQSREELITHCNKLEKTLVLINQGFEKTKFSDTLIKKTSSDSNSDPNLHIEDIHSDDDGNTKRSQTFSLKQPKVLKPSKDNVEMSDIRRKDTPNIIKETPVKVNKSEYANISTQTSLIEKTPKQISLVPTGTQTEDDLVLDKLKLQINNLRQANDKISKELAEAMALVQKRAEDLLHLNSHKINLETTIQSLKESNTQKDKHTDKLVILNENLKRQLDDCKNIAISERNKSKNLANEENKSLLLLLEQLENDKNIIVTEYKELLKKEREEYSKSLKDLNIKVMELQTELDRKGSETASSNGETLKEVITKYALKLTDLEDKCFKLQSELDGRRTELTTYHSEVDRWKDLATERLIKMEQLNSQLEQRHCHEVESYKAENQHWLSQLNETQREHKELRTRITEQKALHVKQLADKDTQIEQLRSVVRNLKTQIMNMHTLISINDPSFDLSAIVEVEETSDILSQPGSDRLELKFDSLDDLRDMQDGIMRMPATSTAIWHEPLIERLRHEKNLTSKQNVILRRQIKALAARERRSRLDAQNLKSQVFRISSGGKATSTETAVLHNKIAALQAQLTTVRRDTQSSIALWDKWKRAQQAAERWQARYDEKFQEVKKLESSLNLAKSAVSRLEKEKRVLLTRLSEVKNESILAIEKQESEVLEKSSRPDLECSSSPPPVSSRALLERVQAQQRRIVALEIAEKGNEFLVAEYEKSLAEITSLKGQVLKLESTLLECQIRSPLKTTTHDSQPELEYWKSYCEMLKEENVQLTLRVNALETTPATTHQHRVNDLEQTVLTLRGLVSKLQAEQRSSSGKRIDSRPSSVRSASDKVMGRTPSESSRIEIANLKRSIMEKDLLLEKSKEMLKIAAEREDELLRENAFLRRQLAEFTKPKQGFLSA